MSSSRVPVIFQMNSVECGAACLAMVLSYFGRKTGLEECRSKVDTGRDGITARTIVTAARAFGLEAKAFSMEAQHLAGASLPCILFWNNNHFVVLERWAQNTAWIVDPGWGRRRLSHAEFAASFSGVALQFRTGANFVSHSERRPNLLLAYLRSLLGQPGTRPALLVLLVTSLLLQVFALVLPFFTRVLVDHVLPDKAKSDLNALGIAAVLVSLISAAVAYCRTALLIRLEKNSDEHLMSEFFRHLLSLPFRFFQQRSSGDLLMRLSSNTTIRETLTGQTISALLDGIFIVIFFIGLLRVSSLFAFAALAIALLEAVVLLTSAGRLQCLLYRDLSCQSVSQSCLVESLVGIATLKASGAEQPALARWSRLLTKQLDASAERRFYSARIDTCVNFLKVFAPLFLLWLSARLVWNGSVTLGTMLAVNALAAAFLQPVTSLVLSAQRLQLAGAHLERIADVMQAEPEQDRSRPLQTPQLSGRIQLRNVSFRYDGQSPNVLTGINLDIYPGQKVALVGRTDSGKSTLAKLLLGLYLPSEGEILYDGVPIQNIDLQALRLRCGIVLQNSFLFQASVRENITLHKPGTPDQQVVWAAKMAEIHTDVERTPMAYEMRIEEAGESLSGGQRQRLALARALVNRPEVLLLDEATSQLDVITEAMIDRNLDTLPCTRLIIAHRLSTIQNADLIVVLDEGRLVEKGTHEELVALNGHYGALIHEQVERLTTLAC